MSAGYFTTLIDLLTEKLKKISQQDNHKHWLHYKKLLKFVKKANKENIEDETRLLFTKYNIKKKFLKYQDKKEYETNGIDKELALFLFKSPNDEISFDEEYYETFKVSMFQTFCEERINSESLKTMSRCVSNKIQVHSVFDCDFRRTKGYCRDCCFACALLINFYGVVVTKRALQQEGATLAMIVLKTILELLFSIKDYNVPELGPLTTNQFLKTAFRWDKSMNQRRIDIRAIRRERTHLKVGDIVYIPQDAGDKAIQLTPLSQSVCL